MTTTNTTTDNQNTKPCVDLVRNVVLTKLEKWAQIDPVGDVVGSTRIIPCKTPISKIYLQNADGLCGIKDNKEDKLLSLLDVCDRLRQRNQELGLIIDLSNHDLIYEVPQGVSYAKISCVSKVLPPKETVRRFCQIVMSFVEQHPDKYVAVHCSYGFNRTGVMVASYMVEECGLSVAEAVQAFGVARPPGIKHQWMIDELHKIYDKNTHIEMHG